MVNSNISMPHTIPFLWMHGEDEAVLRKMVAVINESGNAALCVESRPHPDFIGEKWWKDMDVVLDECQRRNMQVWILDDEKFPTGYTAGKAAGSEYRVRYLNEMHVDIMGPQTGSSILLNIPTGNRGIPNTDPVISVVAAKRIPGMNMDQSTFINIMQDPVKDLIDLTQQIDGDVVYWDIPEGLWRIFVITAHYGFGIEKRDMYLNPLTSEGTKILIDTVYQSHYEHYGQYFGNLIQGFFSDEPQFGGGLGYHAMIGRAPNLKLPWSDEVLGFMNETLGCDAVGLLPGLWTDIGSMTAKVRFAYMDAVTKLYSHNFCEQIGSWCRSHNIKYMGHVIEENNAHARLCYGTGHYFRALWGQDYAGIDIVLNGLIPGIKGGSHAQSAIQFEADDDFFYYCLAQMATSLAHIDPKKKGLAMCEIFGAYGWQEGLKEMKWLADFMLSRGINVFVPHAFSPKAFPDIDCPPHFYAQGENPQYRYFGKLIEYINRVSETITNGTSITETGVIYHAEAEWADSCMMKTQEVIKPLTQHQVEADIIPFDVLNEAEISGESVIVGAYKYSTIVVPYAQTLPEYSIKSLSRISENGVKVIFVDDIPKYSSTDEIDIESSLKHCSIMSISEITDALIANRYINTASFEPDLKLYPYRKDNCEYILAFNEGIYHTIDTLASVKGKKYIRIHDPYLNVTTKGTEYSGENATEFRLMVRPYQLVVIIISDEELPGESQMRTGSVLVDIDGWNVSMASSRDYPVFTPVKDITAPTNLNRKDGYPRFSGTIRYDGSFIADDSAVWTCDLGEVGETAEVFINGISAGVKIVPPYVFDISDMVKPGRNKLSIEVTNTLVYSQHDGFSAYHAIQKSGLIGPVTIKKGN